MSGSLPSVHLNSIGLVVSDMAAALAFYRLLGFEIDPGEDHSPHVELHLDKGASIGFIAETMMKSQNPEWNRKSATNAVNLQFSFSSPASVDQVYNALQKAGYRSQKEPWDAFWGQRFAQIFDPNGNEVNLFAELVD